MLFDLCEAQGVQARSGTCYPRYEPSAINREHPQQHIFAELDQAGPNLDKMILMNAAFYASVPKCNAANLTFATVPLYNQ